MFKIYNFVFPLRIAKKKIVFLCGKRDFDFVGSSVIWIVDDVCEIVYGVMIFFKLYGNEI